MDQLKKVSFGFLLGVGIGWGIAKYTANRSDEFTLLSQQGEGGMPVLYVRRNWSYGEIPNGGMFKDRTPTVERYVHESHCKPKQAA